MEENKENTTQINTEEIKKEATDTVNQVKDTFKNADLKKDANEAKGFFSSFWKEPIKQLENVAHSSKNKFLKTAIIILVVWLVACFIDSVVSAFGSYSYFSGIAWFFKNSLNNVLAIIKAIITPILSIVVLSGIIYFISKEKKKPFIHIASAVVIAKTPVVLASVVSLLEIFGREVYKLTSPFSSFCSIISTVLIYFTCKFLCDEERHDVFFKKFVLIMGIFYIVKFLFSFLGIYI